METTININQLVSETESLEYILARIVSMLKREEKVHQISVAKLKGLRKNVWQKIDTNSYVFTEVTYGNN